MNVFWREIKFYRKGLIFWSLGMIILVWSSMVKYSTFQSSGQSVSELISQFPRSIQTIFGMTGFDLTKVSGFFGVMFMYIALMATIHAVMLGAGILSKEERDKTSEFIYVKPVTRNKVISAKILAGLVQIAVFNLVTLLSSIYFVKVYSHSDEFFGDIFLLIMGLAFLQLIFFFVGTAVAAVSRRPKSSASIAASVLLLAFILTYFINFNADLDFLKYFTPFMYFDAKDILANQSLNIFCIGGSTVLISVLIITSYISINTRDLDV